MMRFALVFLLNWEQFRALPAWSDEARFLLEWKRDPLSACRKGRLCAVEIGVFLNSRFRLTVRTRGGR
jgi:hypothetical protein